MEDYKEIQKQNRMRLKNNYHVFWMSGDPTNPLAKGRTYVNKEKQNKKEKKVKK